MMKKTTLVISAVLLTTALGAGALTASADWGRHSRGDCGMDRGPKAMMKMDRKGKKGLAPMARDLDLTAEQVRTLMSARLIMQGNDRLKVGQITEKDAETYLVQIVTVDDSLVREVEFDRNGGMPKRQR